MDSKIIEIREKWVEIRLRSYHTENVCIRYCNEIGRIALNIKSMSIDEILNRVDKGVLLL